MLSLLAALVVSQTCAAPFVCNDGDQLIGGQKVGTNLWQFTGFYDWGGPLVSTSMYGGVALGGPIVPLLSDQPIVLRGGRIYLIGKVSIENECGQVLVIDDDGNFTPNAALKRNDAGVCTQTTNVLHSGMLKMGNTASGAIAIQSAPKSRVTFEYSLAENCGKLPDGGEPVGDGGAEFVTLWDGGTCFAYAGKHAGVEALSSVAQQQGFMFSTISHGVYGGDMKFAVHATGAAGPLNGLLRSEFANCPSPLVGTDFGQFYPGVGPGFTSWANDEQKLYVCALSGWEQVWP